MKIAYFTDTYAPEINGVTNTLNKLSSCLEKKGIEHVFFAPDYNGESAQIPDVSIQIKNVYRFPGIKVKVSPGSRVAFPPIREIYDLCDGFVPDLVHVVTEFGIGYRGMKYALSRKLPLVMSSHTDYCRYLRYFDLGPLEPAAEMYLKWFYGFSNKTLVPSTHTLKLLEEKKYKNLGIWSRGIDTSKFNAGFKSKEARDQLRIGDKFAFLYVGRLSPEKGLHMLLHAIGEINREFPDKAVFVFTGDGPYVDTIRQSDFDNVILTGFKSGRELSEIYASCDCFAFPSGTETFGNTALEAMASGLPVAGISNGGVTDFLTHGYNALLSPDGDQELFTRNLISIMESVPLRGALSKNGIKTALSRNWDEIFDNLLEDYVTVIEKKALAARKHTF